MLRIEEENSGQEDECMGQMGMLTIEELRIG